MGHGSQGGVHLQYRGGILNIDLLPKVAIEIVIPDELEDTVISQILSAARVGKEGDGKIFVIPIHEASQGPDGRSGGMICNIIASHQKFSLRTAIFSCVCSNDQGILSIPCSLLILKEF